jgi:hypothetical protein
MSQNPVTVRLVQRHDYQFDVQFGDHVPVLRADEPPRWARAPARRPCSCWRLRSATV